MIRGNGSKAKNLNSDFFYQRINDRGDAGIGGAHERQAFLDGADARLLQMLIGTGAVSEPAVIGDVDDPAGPLAARHNITRKNDLVADQRQRNRRAWYSDRPAPIAGKETAALLGELLKTEMREDPFERQIFAERHEMDFVVERDDRA